MKILLGVTGSVAATLTEKMAELLSINGHKFQVVATEKAQLFFDYPCYVDKSEEILYKKEKKVLHIELTKWADKFIIAPCSANSLAKLANGICDNLVMNCARAWDFSKPFVVAPAMNTKMWEHRVTEQHLKQLRSWSIIIREPVSKTLFCGDEGIGAMAKLEDIIK